jgi:hypothetical protein
MEYFPEFAQFEIKLSNGDVLRITDVVFEEMQKKIPIKTDKDKIMELKDKIHQLRTKKLLTIGYLEEQAKALDGELTEVQKDLRKENGMNPKVATALIKAIDARRGIVRELRLATSFLTKEEERLELELLKVSG